MSKGRETRETSIDNADFLLLPFPPRFLRSPIHRVQLNLTYLGKKLLLGVYDANRSLLAIRACPAIDSRSGKNEHSSSSISFHDAALRRVRNRSWNVASR